MCLNHLFPVCVQLLYQEPGKLSVLVFAFQILLRLSQMSASHGVEGMEGISHLGNFFKTFISGP